ncbi:hypothetical protein FGO68_gene753 [Halteria grandinella]|uniref:Uncharacterized protein n=1 Tax=Halteria grandinella TaxID=5974 RepID=A0A8J8P1H7_HALGN|nr:hypothetical protein FGO68_gene753 [Halteria grandinella]
MRLLKCIKPWPRFIKTYFYTCRQTSQKRQIMNKDNRNLRVYGISDKTSSCRRFCLLLACSSTNVEGIQLKTWIRLGITMCCLQHVL